MQLTKVILSGLAFLSATALAAPYTDASNRKGPEPAIEQLHSDVLSTDQGVTTAVEEIKKLAAKAPSVNDQERSNVKDKISDDFNRIVNIVYPLADQVQDDLQMIGKQRLSSRQRDSIRESLDTLKAVIEKLSEAIQATYNVGDTDFDWIAKSFSKQLKDELFPIVNYISNFGNALREGSFRRDILADGGDTEDMLSKF